jgi:hypothetical protein
MCFVVALGGIVLYCTETPHGVPVRQYRYTGEDTLYTGMSYRLYEVGGESVARADSVKLLTYPQGMYVTDSAIRWRPAVADTGPDTLRIRLYEPHAMHDVTVPVRVCTAQTGIRDTVYTGITHTFTTMGGYTLASMDSFHVRSPHTGVQCSDTRWTWKPARADTGYDSIHVALYRDAIRADIRTVVRVHAGAPASCPPYTKTRAYVNHGAPAGMHGFFIYTIENRTGIWISPLHAFAPRLIPHTQEDEGYTVDIDSTGQWICYIDIITRNLILMRTDGTAKTILPTQVGDTYYPTFCGFYKQGPLGKEIFYLADERHLRALGIRIRDDSVHVIHDRVLVDMTDTYVINGEGMGIDVVAERVLASIGRRDTGDGAFHQTGFITIPDGGRGTAGPDDVYQWSEPVTEAVYGCGHTLSPRGRHALYNPGYIGDAACIPTSGHNGFVVTPFRFVDDPALDYYTEHIQQHGTSINFCPDRYQGSTVEEADFWSWNFTNDSSYVAGRQLGSIPESGVWLVDWRHNAWYRLTPVLQNIRAFFTACHIHETSDDTIGVVPPVDTGLVNDTVSTKGPYFEIISPNGGETWTAGDTCTIISRTSTQATVTFKLLLDNGLGQVTLPPGAKTSYTVSDYDTLSFVMPPTLYTTGGDSVDASTRCAYVGMYEYDRPGIFFDISDSCFTVGE